MTDGLSIGGIPKRFLLTAGAVEGSTHINAFDAALVAAGVGDTNLVKLSSILPPGAEEIAPYPLPKGWLVSLAYGECVCSKPGALISAAVALHPINIVY